MGVVGFCMGGELALTLAAHQGERIGAAVPFYGAPLGDDAPDWEGLRAPVLGHFAENDEFFPTPVVRQLQGTLEELGKDVTFRIYPDAGHGFANEENPLGTYDETATRESWNETVSFFRTTLP